MKSLKHLKLPPRKEGLPTGKQKQARLHYWAGMQLSLLRHGFSGIQAENNSFQTALTKNFGKKMLSSSGGALGKENVSSLCFGMDLLTHVFRKINRYE